jgi:hypothetical protein
MADIQIGTKVGYDAIPHLMNYKGIVVSLGRTPHGGDCVVDWYAGYPTPGKSEECLSNLRVLRDDE